MNCRGWRSHPSQLCLFCDELQGLAQPPIATLMIPGAGLGKIELVDLPMGIDLRPLGSFAGESL